MNKIVKQNGMSLIGAVFVMVVLALVGAYLVSLNAMQHSGTSLSLQASRAFHAANSGVEWVAWYTRTSVNKNNCPMPGTTFNLDNFTVKIETCTETTVTEGSESYKIFDTTVSASTADRNFGDSDYSSRSLHVRIVGPR